MRAPLPQFRFRAVSMEFAAQLDERRVDMLIVTADGTTIAVECENDTIFEIQRHIAQMARDCPEIATWNVAPRLTSSCIKSDDSYDAAVSEGWPVAPPTALEAGPVSHC